LLSICYCMKNDANNIFISKNNNDLYHYLFNHNINLNFFYWSGFFYPCIYIIYEHTYNIWYNNIFTKHRHIYSSCRVYFFWISTWCTTLRNYWCMYGIYTVLFYGTQKMYIMKYEYTSNVMQYIMRVTENQLPKLLYSFIVFWAFLRDNSYVCIHILNNLSVVKKLSCWNFNIL